MEHLQYLPGDPRLVDQLVYELKSKGIFDRFRKECIADVDTRPAYQNLRQRVESSVAMFLSRQVWRPDLNKNQLREKLRKHLLEGNYLEQGVERIVDQVVNPKVASVFIPQVEDLIYNYLGIPHKKSTSTAETSNGKVGENDLLPTDLEAVSPGSVKSNDDKNEDMDVEEDVNMDIDNNSKMETKDDSVIFVEIDKDSQESRLSGISDLTINESVESIDKSTIPLPTEEIKPENIPAPENSPPKIEDQKIDLENIDLPHEPNVSTDIPLPDEIPKVERDNYFKPRNLLSEDDQSSSDSSIIRNMSPLTPIRNFNNENSCDAQQAFEQDSDSNKPQEHKEPSSFRFTIENKSPEKEVEVKEMKEPDTIPYQFNTQVSQVNPNTFSTPQTPFDDSSNSNNLQIDYESDANSKVADIKLPEPEQNSEDSKKLEKKEEKRSSHKSSSRSRDSHRHSSSKDKKSDIKHSSRDSSRHERKREDKPKDDKAKSSSSSKEKEKTSDKSDKKESRDSSKHRSSHKSSRDKDSKYKSSSSSKNSSSKHDERKSSSSSSKDKEKSEKSSNKGSKDRSKDSKSSYHRSDKERDRKSKSKSDEKENKEKKEKKEADDHYSLSGRGNPNRRSTDRDSNDGSSSSKGSHNPSSSKSSGSKKDNKSSSKSENTTTSSDTASPSDKEIIVNQHTGTKLARTLSQSRPVRVDAHLETPVSTPPRLPFVPDVTLKKPKFAANFEQAKQMMKMRKFLDDEQKRMNQEAALLLEFQANVRPSLSQAYSSISGPELEFCVDAVEPVQVAGKSQSTVPKTDEIVQVIETNTNEVEEKTEVKLKDVKDGAKDKITEPKDMIAETLLAMHHEDSTIDYDHVETVEENIMKEDDQSILETLSNDEKTQPIIIVENSSKSKNVDDNSVADNTKDFEVTIITEELSDSEDTGDKYTDQDTEDPLKYFGEQEKFIAELERDTFDTFLKIFTQKTLEKKLFLINCDINEENLMRDAAQTLGNLKIVNYHKNGHLKLPKATKKIIKNINVANEIKLPSKVAKNVETTVKFERNEISSPFSPVKSECSFELSDYDSKLDDMVNTTSRKQIMEIILGNFDEDIVDEPPNIQSPPPPVVEHSDKEIDFEEAIDKVNSLKRKIEEIESNVNNNRPVLAPSKVRKMSDSDLISSTTQETEEASNKSLTKSKYLGKARRVGLPKPKRTTQPNSPSSDKSVENYETNMPTNGKARTPRSKVQRYDTSDLYKPKLHYLSRRNNIT